MHTYKPMLDLENLQNTARNKKEISAEKCK